MRVKYFVDSFYPTILPNDPATKARALMRDLGLRMIPVVDSYSGLHGLIRRENILLITSTRSNALARNIMDTPALSFKPGEDALNAFKVMIELDEWYAPVIDGIKGKFMGVLTLDSLLRYLIKTGHEALKFSAEEVMSRDVEYVYPEDFISRLWRKMTQLKFSGFPVVKNKSLITVGIITQHDLLKKGYTRVELESPSGPKHGPRVRDAMTTPPITVKPEATLREVVLKMVKSNIGRLPVVNDKMSLAGIIDRSDICRAFLSKELR